MAKPVEPVAGVEPGDHVYVQHPRRGPIAVKVLAHGRDGLQGECDMGERHRVAWNDVLGHKARQLQNYTVVDQGADGAILQDDKGRRRYMAGGGIGDEQPQPADGARQAAKSKRDDPLLDGMEKLQKAFAAFKGAPLPGENFLFMKADPPAASRPGLTLKPVTDKRGVQTKRWVRTMQDQPSEKHAAAPDPDAPVSQPHRHGDDVKFRAPGGEGAGKIIASGADGVTVKDAAGKEHQVRHEDVVNPGQTATPAENDAKVATPAPAGADPLFSEEEVGTLPAKAPQPFTDEESLYKASAEALDHLKGWLDQGKGVCSQLGIETMPGGPDDADMDKPGGMLFIANLKGKARAAEKVRDDYNGDWSQLRDVTRASIALDSMEGLQKTLDVLKKSGLELAMKPKDRFAKPLPVGYRDLLLNIKFPNGVIGELQMHLKPMLKGKADGHKPYEVMRTIEGTPEKDWTAEQRSAYKEAFDQSVEIYEKAWQECRGAMGQKKDMATDDDMAKAMTASGAAWDFFDHGGASFRRPKGNIGGVTHVLAGREWKEYAGDRLKPSLYGDRIDDPLGGETMTKAEEPRVLFIKADVAGYTKKDGTFVRPHSDSRPHGEWYLHKTTKEGAEEHRKVLSEGKPNYSGSGKKMRTVHIYPDGNAYAQSEHGYTTKHGSLEAAKAYLDRP
jgi:hypothetical protein